MPFQKLGLCPALVRAAAEMGFAVPTPIQTQAIPAVLSGADVLGTAQTGSGKTAAYALPLLERLHSAGAAGSARRGAAPVRVLIITPTRELAAQVGAVMRRMAFHLAQVAGDGAGLGHARREPPRIAVVFGGVSINPQMMGLRGGADVVVATPGRLLDLVAHNALQLGQVQSLVLDEADRLLDLGFSQELRSILALLPAQRQNLFFSATFPAEVQGLAEHLLHDPVRVDIASAPALDPHIVQRAIAVDAPARTQLLRHLVQTEAWPQALVFVATQYAAEHVSEKLGRANIHACAFHGGLSQGARKDVLDAFKAKRFAVLVTTDLAARGIDIVQLPVVVIYDLPRSATDYVHRIGRTARAGAKGTAISFVSVETQAHFRLIEKRQGLALALETIAGFERSEPAAAHDDGAGAGKPSTDTQPQAAQTEAPRGLDGERGGIKGVRPSKKDKLRAAAQLARDQAATGG